LNLPRDDDWRLLEAWLETSLASVPAGRDWAALAKTLAGRSAPALVERGREIGLAVAIARAAPDPVAPLFRLELESQACADRASEAAHPDASPREARRRPRVLDLSTLWAGPLAGSLLAQAGFDVLKIESPTRPDGARQGEPGFFDLLNGGKRGLALDLSAPADREVFTRLLETADIVLESARPRALGQLGFDARAWLRARPGRLWTSITGYGRDHEWIAFGDDAAVAAGLAFDPASPPHLTNRLDAPDADGDGPTAVAADRGPRFCGDAIADPLTGLHAAVAVVALQARGRGGLLSLALAEVAAHAASGSAHGPLVLPLEPRAGGWAVFDGARWQPVAPARARIPGTRGAAPTLRRPDAGCVEGWGRPC
jgi:hypothetical protein